MEDRELLEAAAKAAGIDGDYSKRAGAIVHADGYWMPLSDDGDALRLAVTLKIEIEFFGDTAYAGPRKTAKYAVSTEFDRDIFATARLAIVRAAAEIGKSMP